MSKKIVSFDELSIYDTKLKDYIENVLGLKIDSSLTNIAPTYSSESTYSTGDYVVYSGYLYVCDEDIEVAEEFDSSKWTQTNIASIIGNLNKVLATLTTVTTE